MLEWLIRFFFFFQAEDGIRDHCVTGVQTCALPILNVRHRMGPHGIGKIYGQEKNITTYNLARMNMLLHGVKDTEFEIYHGDTLTNDWDFLREMNPAKKPAFDVVVANPPFSYRWDTGEDMSEDMRFKAHGVAPKS